MHAKQLDKRLGQYIKTTDIQEVENIIDDLIHQAKSKGITPNKVIRYWSGIYTILERLSKKKYNLEITRLMDGSIEKKAIQKKVKQ